MKKLIILQLIVTFFLSPGRAQNTDVTSPISIRTEPAKVPHDSTRIKLRTEKGEQEMISRISYWDSLSHDAKNLAEKNIAAQGSSALTIFYIKHSANALNNIGYFLELEGKVSEAIEYYHKSLKIQEEINDKKGMAFSLNNIGVSYNNYGDIPRALEYYHRSLKLLEEAGDSVGITIALNNIGFIAEQQGETDKALDYYDQCLKIQEELKDSRGIANTLNNIGFIYDKLGNIPKALECYERSLELRQEINDEIGIALSLNNIGIAHAHEGDINQALEYYQKSLRIYEEIHNQHGIAIATNNIGAALLRQGNMAQALFYATRSLQISKELGYPDKIRQAAFTLKSIYKEQNDFKSAYEMFELEIQMRDSITNEQNQKAIFQKQVQYQYQKKATVDSVAFVKEKEINEAEIAKNKAELAAKKNLQYALFGGLFLVVVFAGFVYNRYKITQKQNVRIEQQKHIVEEKNKEITDSINYAKRIQAAILPPNRIVKTYLPESFVLYKPKDIVAGDFYWLETKDDKVLFAAADCTGHGVPGAMVSVICNNGLNRSVREHGLTDPGTILDKTREIVIQEFEKSDDEVKDGMDISLCSLIRHSDGEGGTLLWAGANNPLWIIRAGATEVEEVKADKQPIGKYMDPKPFTTHKIQLQKGDSIYVFTDGYQDQFGGERGKKFKASAFKTLLLSIQKESMEKQKELIDQTFKDWVGNLEQIDDVCVIGVRV